MLTFVGCDGGITDDCTPEFILVGYSTASTLRGTTELLPDGVQAFTVSVDEALEATEGTSFVCVVVVTIEVSAELTVGVATAGVRRPSTFFFGGGCFLIIAGVESIISLKYKEHAHLISVKNTCIQYISWKLQRTHEVRLDKNIQYSVWRVQCVWRVVCLESGE